MNKHNANICILKILQKYTDEEHSLTQQEILRLLEKEYDLKLDRRSVRSNIEFLQDAGYEIDTDKGYRLITRTLEDAELRILIDSILFLKYLPAHQAQELIDKLSSMSSKYLNDSYKNIVGIKEQQYSDYQQMLYSISQISRAIDQNKMIRYTGCHYGTDFERHPIRQHSVSPYRIVANNGRFYLLCHDTIHGNDNVAYYRIDRMRDVEILQDERYPSGNVEQLREGINLSQHMAEHVYMFRGNSVPIKIKATTDRMDDLVDWFGKDFSILDNDGKSITVRLHCNEDSFFFWALQYGLTVEVLEPASLRERIKEAVNVMHEKYGS